jgi:rfaE bifunctional protein nucleotidyltransferase chain/domain
LASKNKPLKELLSILAGLKKQKKTVVFTNGCFDILHAGHAKLFEKAKALGDVLVVGLNTDKSVKRLKGPKRPLVGQQDRGAMISALASVDYVVFFNEDTPFELIKKIRPDILVKGGDYKAGEIVGREFAKKVVRIPLAKGRSTSALIQKIVERYK